ncbi:MAG: Maf family protein [Candidatus Dormibacteria bacterium]
MSDSKIILASSSPQRRVLLTRAGIRIAIVEPPGEMAPPPGMCADLAVQLIARQKAVAVAEGASPGTFVIAADTRVVGPHGSLGKPGTAERARDMLLELRGRRHTVLTGVCVVVAGSEAEALALSRSAVKMREVSDEEIATYVAGGEPLDKAGAYAIQGGGSDFIEAVSGRVDTVIGLDVALALRLLAEAGYPDPLPACTDTPLQPRQVRRALVPMRAASRV